MYSPRTLSGRERWILVFFLGAFTAAVTAFARPQVTIGIVPRGFATPGMTPMPPPP